MTKHLNSSLRRRAGALLAGALVGLAAAPAGSHAAACSGVGSMPNQCGTAAKPDLTIANYGKWNTVEGYVTVKNQGTATSAATSLRASTADGKSVVLSVPALSPGASITIHHAYIRPAECSSSVFVDHTNVVAESNESNNTVSGYCVR